MAENDQDPVAVEDDAPLGHRLTRAIKHAIFGGGKDENLPDEHPRKDEPAVKARREGEHAARQHTQNMDRLADWGKRISGNAAVQNEIAKAKKRQGKSELDATREALGQKDE